MGARGAALRLAEVSDGLLLLVAVGEVLPPEEPVDYGTPPDWC